jgi:thiaminase
MYILNKNLNKNRLDKNYSNYIVKNSSAYVITRFMRKLCICLKTYKEIIDNIEITQKTLALYYFIFYTKKYINNWYNNSIQWKKDIILSYNPKNIVNPTRFDIYSLIKRMAMNDVYSIGW